MTSTHISIRLSHINSLDELNIRPQRIRKCSDKLQKHFEITRVEEMARKVTSVVPENLSNFFTFSTSGVSFQLIVKTEMSFINLFIAEAILLL